MEQVVNKVLKFRKEEEALIGQCMEDNPEEYQFKQIQPEQVLCITAT
jgi:hypothetical protein